MQRTTLIYAFLALAITGPVQRASAQPGTDIYLVRMSVRDGSVALRGLVNATDRDGYDNQPHFGPSGAFVLYTSGRPDGQTDIYRLDVASGRVAAVTETPESEYSATPLPDGSGFSVIRVEADSSQRLWRFDMRGQNPELIFERIMPVGYQAWSDESTAALFVLGSPPTLQLADTRTGTARVIEQRVGRSIHRMPGEHAISFVHKVSDDEWWIRRLDPETRRTTALVRTLAGAEDYAWTPGGIALMGSESVLYQWTPGNQSWVEVADFADRDVKGISRIAVSPTGEWIAIVGNRE